MEHFAQTGGDNKNLKTEILSKKREGADEREGWELKRQKGVARDHRHSKNTDMKKREVWWAWEEIKRLNRKEREEESDHFTCLLACCASQHSSAAHFVFYVLWLKMGPFKAQMRRRRDEITSNTVLYSHPLAKDVWSYNNVTLVQGWMKGGNQTKKNLSIWSQACVVSIACKKLFVSVCHCAGMRLCVAIWLQQPSSNIAHCLSCTEARLLPLGRCQLKLF